MAANIRVRVTPGEFDDNMTRAAVMTPRILTGLILRIIIRAESNVIERTPVGAFGNARGGWSHELRRANTTRPVGVVANPTPYLDALDDGRRPGKRPPVAALIPWVGSKLGVPIEDRDEVAFLVARAIGRRGTSGAHMVADGWKVTRKQTRSELKKAGLAIVRSM